MCKPFDDGRLAHAWLTNEDRVVLCAAAQHLNRTSDLFHATNDGIELALTSEVGYVTTVLLECFELRFCVLARHTIVAAQLLVHLLDALSCNARVLK